MDLKESINARRSIRKFKDKDVPNQLIEDLIDSARLAPSAKNRQPWKFIIVKDRIKNQISDLMLEQLKTSNHSEERNLLNCNSSVKSTAEIIKEAPILILVLRPREDIWLVGDTLSIGAAIEHICLRATDLDLGSLWIRDTVYAQKEILELLHYEHMELSSAISIGYPNQNPAQRPRKNLEEIMEWF